jgi:hypothetical protein
VPVDLVAIISHLELQQTAWWSDAVQSVVLTTLYQAGSPLLKGEIQSYVQLNYKLELAEQALGDSLVDLEAGYKITKLGDERFKLADDAAARVRLSISQWQLQREAAQELFSSLVLDLLPDVDAEAVWNKFQKDLLEPMVIKLGVSAWTFLINDISAIDQSLQERLGFFLLSFPEDQRELLKRAILSFFDPELEASRRFIADTLNAYFFLTACGLSVEQIEYIEKTLRNFFDTVAFFDVDLLLAANGLSDSDTNELVFNLLESRESWRLATIDYFAAAITVQEAVKTLKVAGTIATNDTTDKLLPQGPLVLSVRGVIAAFLGSTDRDYQNYFLDWANALAGRPPLPAYPLRAIAAGSAPTIDAEVRAYGITAGVAVGETLSAESDARIRHDVLLRHGIKELRGGEWSELHRSRYWLVTNNDALLRFDALSVRRGTGYPTCVHPLTFLQMLRLSTPRSEGWDRATISSLRMLLVQMGTPGKLDQAATRVLGALARYGHRGLTDEQMLSSVLNEEFRRLTGQRPKIGTFVAEDAEVIRQEMQEVKVQLEIVRAENAQLRTSLEINEKPSADRRMQPPQPDPSFWRSGEPGWGSRQRGWQAATVCRRGHVAADGLTEAPITEGLGFCVDCGAQITARCPACGIRIRGRYYNPDVEDLGPFELTRFCDGCGEPYPWATRQDRIYQLENLLDEEDVDEPTKLLVREDLERLRLADAELDQDAQLAIWRRIKSRTPGLLAGAAWNVGQNLLSAYVQQKLGLA